MTELEVIRAARRDLLVTRWQECFNVNPPPRVHTDLPPSTVPVESWKSGVSRLIDCSIG